MGIHYSSFGIKKNRASEEQKKKKKKKRKGRVLHFYSCRKVCLSCFSLSCGTVNKGEAEDSALLLLRLLLLSWKAGRRTKRFHFFLRATHVCLSKLQFKYPGGLDFGLTCDFVLVCFSVWQSPRSNESLKSPAILHPRIAISAYQK